MKENKRTQRYGMRFFVLLILLGMLVEVSVQVNDFALKQDWGQFIQKYPQVSLQLLDGINSSVGLLGALLLALGVISFATRLRVSHSALQWVYLFCGLYCLAKSYDVLNTVWGVSVEELFKTYPFTDELIRNVLLVTGAIALLTGMIIALYDAHRFNIQLEEKNRQLDVEMRAHQDTAAQAVAREDELSTILNALNSPVFLTNREGYVLAHNAAFARVWGDHDKSLVGVHLRRLLPEDVFEEGKKQSLKVFEQHPSDTQRLTILDRTYDVNVYPVLHKSGDIPCVTILARDVTDKLRAEAEQRLLQAAVNSAAESIIIMNRDGLIEYVNPAFEEQTGYSRAEVCGQSPRLLGSGAQDEAYYEKITQVIIEEGVWRGRLINRRKDGATLHEMCTISTIVDETGASTHFIAVGRNITREVDLEDQLQQARKMEALARFAGGIAHDLNNTLAIILGRSEIGAKLLDKQHPVQQSLEAITRNANRSAALIKRLLTFARQKTGVSGPLYVAPLLQEQVELLRKRLPDNIFLKDTIDEESEVITAELGAFEGMVEGLVDNAVRAMQPGGGELEITLENVILERERQVATGILAPGSYVLLSVSDTGYGMEPSVQQRIFDPFFTTRKMGEGIGIGLTEVHGNVRRAGGHIGVESILGRGTRIDIYWPWAAQKVTVPPAVRPSISGAGLSVLLIDDTDDFVTLIRMELMQNGFKVYAFRDPEKAIKQIRDNLACVDVAVVDYIMPGMSGAEVAQALHDLRPDLPLVLLTGYSSDITRENAREYGFQEVVEKPVRMGVLPGLLTKLVRGN